MSDFDTVMSFAGYAVAKGFYLIDWFRPLGLPLWQYGIAFAVLAIVLYFITYNIARHSGMPQQFFNMAERSVTDYENFGSLGRAFTLSNDEYVPGEAGRRMETGRKNWEREVLNNVENLDDSFEGNIKDDYEVEFI